MKTYNKGAAFEMSHMYKYQNKRKIPFGIMFKIWIKNPSTIIGIFMILGGLPFIFGFVSFSDLFATSFNENDPVIIGVIVESNPTNSYINEIRVYEYKYQYKLNDGNIYSGVGYSTGNIKNNGEEIRIHYKQDDPAQSKALDLRNSEFGGWIGLIVLIFPLVGIAMLYFVTRKAIRQILILQIGNIAEGKLISKKDTNVSINDQTVYELTFEFKAEDNNVYQAIAKTHQVYLLEDEEFEKLVYDPEKPENAVLLDELPSGIKDFFLNLA